MAEAQYYLGLISGTSADGVDAALVQFDEASSGAKARVVASYKLDYPNAIKQEIVALCTPTTQEVDRLGQLDIHVGELFAEAALYLLRQENLQPSSVIAIGSHGQTVRHRPMVTKPFTLQIGDPNTIAELTGITTIADFRRRDMAVKGQGAPLAPSFHHYLFAGTQQTRCILNIGGIANITVLTEDKAPVGYDTGPGNGLMDAWISNTRQQAYDHNGAWAASGKADEELLKHLLNHSYFQMMYPKSTGREEFHFAWLQQVLTNLHTITAADVQATLCEFSALTIAQEILRHECHDVYVCGGGAHNNYLLQRLSYHLPLATVSTTEALGVHPDWMEAACFAWLAKQCLAGLPGNLPSVTGAAKPVILGGIYQAS